MKFRKLLALLCILAITFSFAACTNEPPEPEGRTPEQAIEGFMAAYAAMDYDMLAEYYYEPGLLSDFYFGNDLLSKSEQIVVKELVKRQTYEIVELKDVSETEKTATILLTYYDVNPFLIETSVGTFYENITTPEELLQAVYDARIEKIADYKPEPAQKEIELTMHQFDNDWYIDVVDYETSATLLANSVDFQLYMDAYKAENAA